MPAAGTTIAAIVADDLTGATDSAVQFSRAGWDARLVLGTATPTGSAERDLLLAVTADNRASGPAEARAATASAVRRVRADGATLVYLKVDSTIRGSIGPQIDGALEVLAPEHPEAIAVVCPAYPGMGRTVEGGVLRVDGVPVADTGLRNDPVTPVTVSDLRELLPGAVALDATAGYAAGLAAAADAARAGGPRIVVADAGADADLADLAEAIAGSAGTVVPVGSAGLATALAPVWGGGAEREPGAAEPQPGTPPDHEGRIVVQVTSLNAVSLGQIAHLQAQCPEGRCRVLAPDVDTILDSDATARWFSQQGSDWSEYDLVIVRAPVERSSAGGDSGRIIATHIGSVTAELLRSGAFSGAGFVGGDGARAGLAALGVSTLRVLDNLEEGIPMSVTLDGDAPGTPLFTKAGGFGSPDSLATAVARLRGTPTRRNP